MGGALHVGPESAGAQPGPVCYGRGGTEPTITDANLILGRLAADRFLGGEMRLDVEGARGALEADAIAAPLGLDLIAAADGILRIATTKMSHVVRWVTTERGLDAADFASSPMAAPGRCMRRWWRANCASRRSSSRARPAISPPTACWSRTCGVISSTPGSRRWPRHRFRPWKISTPRWRRAAARRCNGAASPSPASSVQRAADMRYVGQEHAVTVELPVELFRTEDRDGIKRRFDAVHETRYGYSAPAEKAEIVSLRTAIIGLMRKPPFEPIAVGEADAAAGGVSRHACRSISPKPAASWTRRPMTERRCSPTIASPDRR